MTLILALDFGGTKLAAATVKAGAKEWLDHESRFSPTNGDALTDLEIMRSLIDSVLKGKKPDAIGVSFGGPVDATTGLVRLSHHVSGWENVPLKQIKLDFRCKRFFLIIVTLGVDCIEVISWVKTN